MSDQNPAVQAFSGDDPFGLISIVSAIQGSLLSDGKKLAYLTMIARGTFSLQALTDLKQHMRDATAELEKKGKTTKDQLQSLEKEAQNMNLKLDSLALQSAREMKEDMGNLLVHASQQQEKKTEKKHQRKINELKKILHRES